MKQYLIPRNVKTRFEFFTGTGIGWFELGFIILGATGGGFISLLLGFFTKFPLIIFLLPLFTLGAFSFVKQDQYGQSTYRWLLNMRHWKTQQRRYLYISGRGRQNVK